MNRTLWAVVFGEPEEAEEGSGQRDIGICGQRDVRTEGHEDTGT